MKDSLFGVLYMNSFVSIGLFRVITSCLLEVVVCLYLTKDCSHVTFWHFNLSTDVILDYVLWIRDVPDASTEMLKLRHAMWLV